MPATKMGLDLSGMQNVTAPTFDIANTTDEFFQQIPQKANEMTGGLYGAIVLGGLFLFLYWKMTQSETAGGEYGYNPLRGLGISTSICSILGLYALNMGYFVNFYHVVIFIVISYISIALTWKSAT